MFRRELRIRPTFDRCVVERRENREREDRWSSLIPTSDITLIRININIRFLCSSGNGRTKNLKNGIPMHVSVVYTSALRTEPAKTQWPRCVIVSDYVVMIFAFPLPKNQRSHRHNHNHKKMIDHFLMIIIMLIIRVRMIMFLSVPTKT